MITLRLLLAARGERRNALAARLEEERLRAEQLLGDGSRALILRRLEKDFFAAQYPEPRGFEAVLAVDVEGEPADATARLLDVARGADERLGDLLQCDLSGALIGERRRIKGGEGPIRFLYLMRHKAGQTTESYQEHWGGPHAEFGRRTEGITGYDQLHVAPDASRAAARVAGFAVWRVDGIAELHMNSLDEFVRAAVGSSAGTEAIEDEKSFVDGPNSVGFSCEVLPRPER